MDVKLPVLANLGLANNQLLLCKILLACVALRVLAVWVFSPEQRRIKGLFEVPGAWLITGHLLALGDDHATVCEGWWKKYSQSIFQIQLGNTRAVVVNSFEDCKRMLLGFQSATIDRPTLYTFHGVISSTKGFTIGSSPWNESTKNKRKAAGAALSRPAMKSYHPMFDLETLSLLRDTYYDSQGSSLSKRQQSAEPTSKSTELDIRPYIQRLALNTTLTLCYGLRMSTVDDALLREILTVGSAISLLRSASENFQDYVPALRILPRNEKNMRSRELRARRDRYLDTLLDGARERMARGVDRPCISSAVLRDEETKLSVEETSSVCLSLVSGGFETIPGTLTSCIGSLATREGQIFQQRAFDDIRRHYPDDTLCQAFAHSFADERVPYVNALVKETARYYTVSAMSLPRKAAADIQWDAQTLIPAGTMVLINAQAANHDVSHFGPDAGQFNPERWLEPDVENRVDDTKTDGGTQTSEQQQPSIRYYHEKTMRGPAHFGFGAGSRACSGQLVAQRLLYCSLVRLIAAFRIEASEEAPPVTDYVEYNAMKSALVAIPRDFRVKLVPRDPEALERALEEAEQRTKDAYVE